MASSSNRRSGSSGRSNPRKRVVIGAHETVRVRYDQDEPVVESERAARGRGGSTRAKRDAANVARGRQPETGKRRQPGAQRAAHAKAPRSAQGKRLSNAKREERERRQRGIRLRRYGAAAVAVSLFAALVWGVVALARSDLFAVTKVEVQGTRHLSVGEVRALAAVPAAATMFTVSASAIEDRVSRSPWIGSVDVTRDFPHGLRIAITERVPAAVIDAGGKDLWVVSRDGLWLGERSAEESGVPVVRDVENVVARPGRRVAVPEVLNAARIAAALSKEMRARTAYISAPSIEKTAVITTDEVEVYFGDATDIATKERIALEILKREKGKVVYVNVRVVESPTWRGISE